MLQTVKSTNSEICGRRAPSDHCVNGCVGKTVHFQCLEYQSWKNLDLCILLLLSKNMAYSMSGIQYDRENWVQLVACKPTNLNLWSMVHTGV